MAKCKGCGAEIIWIMSPAGKVIPCDPIPVPYWQRSKAKGKIVTRNGEVISIRYSDESWYCAAKDILREPKEDA